MDVVWQSKSPKANGALAAIGAQAYDDHLYFFFGVGACYGTSSVHSNIAKQGVANPNEQAYMTHLCNLNRLETDTSVGNKPVWFGEWSLGTQFNASDAFLKKWADAQKLIYGQGAGWLFWNFKIEKSELEGNFPRQWYVPLIPSFERDLMATFGRSYFEGVASGYLTRDPAQFHNASVCDPYFNSTASP
jgi:hypothetical protein